MGRVLVRADGAASAADPPRAAEPWLLLGFTVSTTGVEPGAAPGIVNTPASCGMTS
ncbi:MAG: hypothetical protein WA642_21495 [Steroidobacteraceae bacterium]